MRLTRDQNRRYPAGRGGGLRCKLPGLALRLAGGWPALRGRYRPEG